MYDLLVHLEAQTDEILLDYAFALARHLDAHLTGVRVVSPDAALLVLPDPLAFMDGEQAQANEHASWWKALCASRGLAGDWEVHRGIHRRAIARRASLADFVLGRPSMAETKAWPLPWPLDRALYAGSAPAILLPAGCRAPGAPATVALAWNGTAEAASAIHAALPILQRAIEVVVLDGETHGEDDPRPPLPLGPWLARRSIAARWEPFEAADAVGPALLERAEASACDLLVMGAWGHTRAHEYLLGGTTRHALAHARSPLLLSP